ncbi:MAG TPA: DUF6588 family protein [Chryseolinea sp.]
MNSRSMGSYLLKRIFVAVLFAAPGWTFAQNESDLVNFLEAGKNDASKLMGAYLNPVIEGLSYSFNGGWYHTAKAHNSLGFDVGISANAVFLPSSKNYFTPSALGLQNTTLVDPSTGKAPTMVGPSDPTTYESLVDTNGDGTPDQAFTFSGPEGLDFKENIKVSGVLAPTVQLGIGIIKNTDLKIRWMPEVETGSSKVKLLGFGVLHDVKQHIPGLKTLPFDLSALVAFTKIQGTTSTEGEFNKPQNDPRAQLLDYSMNAWLFQALISKKISVVTFYGGIGYNTINTTSDLKGSYVVVDDPSGNNDFVLKDPVSLEFKNKSLRVTAGVRLKFGPIYLNGDYSIQEYNTLSVGLGVAVR